MRRRPSCGLRRALAAADAARRGLLVWSVSCYYWVDWLSVSLQCFLGQAILVHLRRLHAPPMHNCALLKPRDVSLQGCGRRTCHSNLLIGLIALGLQSGLHAR